MFSTRSIIFLKLHIAHCIFIMCVGRCHANLAENGGKSKPGHCAKTLLHFTVTNAADIFFSVARPLLCLRLAPFLVPQEYWCLSSLQAMAEPQEKRSSSQMIKYYYKPFEVEVFFYSFISLFLGRHVLRTVFNVHGRVQTALREHLEVRHL